MRWLGHPLAKPTMFVVYLLPAVWLVWAAVNDQLGANPAEALIRSLGDWTLRALVLVLAVTPLRVVAGWPLLARFRPTGWCWKAGACSSSMMSSPPARPWPHARSHAARLARRR